MYLHDLTSVKIDFTKQEIEDIAFDTKRILIETAVNHWFSYYKCDHMSERKMKEDEFVSFILFKEKVRYERLSYLFGLVGMNYITKNLEEELREVYRKKVKENSR